MEREMGWPVLLNQLLSIYIPYLMVMTKQTKIIYPWNSVSRPHSIQQNSLYLHP